MTKIKRSIQHYFKVVPSGRKPVTPRESTIEQKEIILLSSDEETEAENRLDSSALSKLRSGRARKTMKKVMRSSDDSESETSSEVMDVTETTENSAEKRPLNENEECLDSQDVQPARKRRSTLNRISDSDDENDEGSDKGAAGADGSSETQRTECSQVQSQNTDEYSPGTESSEYSSDSFVTDAEPEIDTDEVNSIMREYEPPDPRHLYENTKSKKKSTKKQKKVSYDDNQEVSIHKIDLNHYDLTGKSVKDIIEFIVDKYNKGKGSSIGETKTSFEVKVVQHEPVVKPEDEEHFKGDRFRVKVYVQKVARQISLLHSYGIKEKATTIHSLIFHYRENELFAITTNQSWNVVQWCSDFEFPGKIAARILSKDGKLQSTNKGLVGTELTRKTTHKQQKKTNPHDLLTLCVRYTAELRDNASILRLSCFQKATPVPVKENSDEDNIEDREEVGEEVEEVENVEEKPSLTKGAKVTVSLGNIRILKRLSTSDILSVLSILSEISNGKETYDLNGDIEQNSTAHNKYLTAVHTERANQLNLYLSEIIHDAIADDNRMAELDNYQLCHKHSSDFFSGCEFKLLYNKDVIKEFSEIPTIKQIVVELRRVLGQLSAGTSAQVFLQRLNNAKMSYRYGTSRKEKKPEKLMNFIDGLLCHSKDNSVFWHVMGMWCHVQDGYINLVHNQFEKILKDYLLTDKKDPAYLRIHWPNNENLSPDAKLKKYLETFSKFPNAWTSDQPERDIFDMIRITKDSDGKHVFFVYYFLPDLNTKTNIKCNRVAESIMQIGKANMQRQNQNVDVAGSEDVRVQLNDVYRKLSQKPDIERICPDFKQFLQMMTEAKFYLAIGRDVTATSIEVPSLANEKEMRKEITTGDIGNILENLIDAKRDDDLKMLKRAASHLGEKFDKCVGQQLAQLIHSRLSEHEYIETNGNAIRGKLLSIGRNSFGITDNAGVNRFLYDKVISKFQPRACTVLSKSGFILFHQEISKLTITSFNLMEIPLQQ
ncbi:uncharacterized protein LOC119079021 isoform X2 [Bradysia coprophila]|uniref:uncharacterized protein LOC119079021 isoform X2 n=1 Tax=Bradysia coprophila TaxID=38358 RepID=UPI00187D9C95|nr:uncharacterized protein LOC119079021 isoform X2 [Bradysia coprophila]